MESFSPSNAIAGLQDFLNTGGPVLLAIAFAAFAMFSFIMERIAYFTMAHKPLTQRLRDQWLERSDHKSWRAHAVREELISQVKDKVVANIGTIKTLVAIAPLLGLLGTVYGMITVFDAMALSGNSSARLMAGGVFRATIPTMAGMVVAIFGLTLSNYIERYANRQVSRFEDSLELT